MTASASERVRDRFPTRILGGFPSTSAPHICRFLLLGVLAPLLAACASIQGAQKPVTAADLAPNLQVCPSEEQLMAPHPGMSDGAYRDAVVAICRKAIDAKYDAFKNALWVESGTTNLGLDVVSQSLSSLASVLKDASTVRSLSAGSAFTQGLSSTISKDLFYKQALPALIASMDARRNRIITGILDAENQDRTAQNYTLARAGYDLDLLQEAGSLAAAVQELTSAAVQNQVQTDSDVKKAELAISIGTADTISAALSDRITAAVTIVDSLETANKAAELRNIATALEINAPSSSGATELAALIRIKIVSVSASTVPADQKDSVLSRIEAVLQPYKGSGT